MAKQTGKPYEPRLIPEKEVIAGSQALLDEIKGTNRIIRLGEYYHMACKCGAREISGSYDKFLSQHHDNCKEGR